MMRFEMKESYLPTLLQMRLLVGFLGERAQGVWQPGWLASQADMLAEDWIGLD